MFRFRNFGANVSIILAMFVMLVGCAIAQDEPAAAAVAEGERVEGPELLPDTRYYAAMTTSEGLIVMHLYEDVAPKTVRNFVNLAEGTRAWRNPRNNRNSRAPFYDGLTFHRVIQGFMLQGGCPLGNGTGGPGYRFEDEVKPDVTFAEKDYLLAMANSGPNTNGSQFFITDRNSRPTHLNMRHTIFGEVIHGKEVVDAIAAVEKGPNDRPVTPVMVRHVQIVRTPADAAADAWRAQVLDIPTNAPFNAEGDYPVIGAETPAAAEAPAEEAPAAEETPAEETTPAATE